MIREYLIIKHSKFAKRYTKNNFYNSFVGDPKIGREIIIAINIFIKCLGLFYSTQNIVTTKFGGGVSLLKNVIKRRVSYGGRCQK